MEDNKKTRNLNATYCGKVLGEGKNKGTTKNGKEWTRFKATFQPKGQDKQWNFAVFSPLTGDKTKQLSDLEEGKEYQIGFNESEQTSSTGREYTSKTIFYIGEPNPELDNKQEENTQFERANENAWKTDVLKVADAYEKKVDPENRELNHFIGVFFRHHNKIHGHPAVKLLEKEYESRFGEGAPKHAEKKDILESVKELDEGKGVPIQGLVEKFGDHAEQMVKMMLGEGELFMVTRGMVKVLE